MQDIPPGGLIPQDAICDAYEEAVAAWLHRRASARRQLNDLEAALKNAQEMVERSTRLYYIDMAVPPPSPKDFGLSNRPF